MYLLLISLFWFPVISGFPMYLKNAAIKYFFMFSISCVCDKQKSTSNEVEWSEWSLLQPPGFCFYMYLEEVPVSVSDSLDSILKSRDFTNKGLSSHSYGFSSSYVWMWELDYKESWAQKN